jgi:hypothetical protein
LRVCARARVRECACMQCVFVCKCMLCETRLHETNVNLGTRRV